MHDNVRGAQPPAFTRRTELVRVLTKEAQRFCVVSTSPWGKWVHWNGYRSEDCTADHGSCDACEKVQPRRWKGYLHCLRGPNWESVFLELTLELFNMLEQQIPAGEPWRGLYIDVSRTAGGRKGRLRGTVGENRCSEAKLPREEDPRALLTFLFNVRKNTRQVDVA